MTVDVQDIQVTKVGEEPAAKNLKVEISAGRVKAAEDDAAAYYVKRAKLPGFRQGKAPLHVVRKQFRDGIRERVIRDLLEKGWKAAVESEGLKPIADPRIRDLKYEEGSPFTFEVMVEVKPELVLARLGNFRLTRKVRPVTDDTVADQIEDLRAQKATWVPVEGQQPAVGEMASVTIATLEGDEVSEPKQYQVVLGSGQAIPELEQQIMLLTPGETRDATVKYPADFGDEAKRGQSRRVRMTLHDVKRRLLPDLTDDLARELGDFESLADLRKAVQSDLEQYAQREADADLRRQVIDEIVSANRLEAPRPLVQRVLSAYAQSYGVPDEQLERFTAEFHPIAERQVLRDLIIDHVAEREKLTATEEEVDRRITEMAGRRKTEPAKLYASLQKSNQIRELERAVTEEKVFGYLLQQSTIVNE